MGILEFIFLGVILAFAILTARNGPTNDGNGSY